MSPSPNPGRPGSSPPRSWPASGSGVPGTTSATSSRRPSRSTPSDRTSRASRSRSSAWWRWPRPRRGPSRPETLNTAWVAERRRSRRTRRRPRPRRTTLSSPWRSPRRTCVVRAAARRAATPSTAATIAAANAGRCRTNASWSPSTSKTSAPSCSASARWRRGETMRSRTVSTEAAGRARSAANPPASKVRSERPAPTWSTTVARFASPISRSRQAATTSSAAPTSVTSFTTPRRSMSKRRARPMSGQADPLQPAEQGGPRRAGRGRHHQPVHQVGVAAGQVERDRPAHRVADRGDRAPAQGGECRRGVVGHRLERKRPLGPQPPPVAPVVDGDERRCARPEDGRCRTSSGRRSRSSRAGAPRQGCPGGPSWTRTNVSPRPGRSRMRPCGTNGAGRSLIAPSWPVAQPGVVPTARYGPRDARLGAATSGRRSSRGGVARPWRQPMVRGRPSGCHRPS